jgi:cell wall-associated NlpC family hydrolase
MFFLEHTHILRNFPKNYPFYKKILANVMYFLSGIIVHPRTNKLTHSDIIKAKFKLRKGDVILAGDLKTILPSFFGEPVTHSALYLGGRKFIHSITRGVQYTSLHHILTAYDTLAILRIPRIRKRRSIIKKALTYARTQYGKPYNFDFSRGPKSFFCTELVNEAFKHAGFHTGMQSVRRQRKIIKKLEEHFTHAVDALLPGNFLKSKFTLVFLSHNLKYTNNKLVFDERS